MATIPLTRGFVTTIDDEDFDNVGWYNWYASGIEGRPARRLMGGPRKLIMMYHQILYVLPWVLNHYGYVVDHFDGNPLNNCKANLRVATPTDNARNTSRHKNRIGICFDRTHGKWKSYLDRPDLPRLNVGTFITEDEAILALEQTKRNLGIKCE